MARQMKDSGVEWIGEIPAEWSSRKLKTLVQESNCLFIDGDWIESKDISPDGIRYYTTGNVGDGVFKEQGAGYISEDTFQQLNCTEVRGGDLVFSRLNLPVGRACIIPAIERCVVAVDIVIARLNSQCINKYVVYATMCDRYQALTSILARGTTMQRISRTQMGNIYFPMPSYAEQKSIIIYLDSKCTEIDKVVEQTRATIEEYKKLKQAIITEAVTKGVRGPRPMKPSGVEWIGDIPEEWNVCNIKLGVSKVGSGKTPSGGAEVYLNEGVLFLRSQNIYDTGLQLDNATYISESTDEEMSSTRVYAGDVLLNITGGSIGRCCVYPADLPPANVNQHVCIIRTVNSIFTADYMHYFWISFAGKTSIQLSQTGGNREGMSADAIKNTLIPRMDISEQQEITTYLDTKCAEIDRIIEKKEQLIEELGSYKKSLIYEYVTGKKEVTQK
ncbi:MAG: restriction endonuclease subunit S [Akkermansia sp.]|nr:restriction endonuclease subunit S [Akkermansia sp.]